MYKEQPQSVLILPAINKTTAVDAKNYYPVTLPEILAESGYYIAPIDLTSELLKEEGLYDTESILADFPLKKFREYFGVDAVLYVEIITWNTKYNIITGSVNIKLHFVMKSTTTSKVIWERWSNAQKSTNGLSFEFIGLITNIVLTALRTASTNYVPLSRKLNQAAFKSIPFGKYSPLYGKDKKYKVRQ